MLAILRLKLSEVLQDPQLYEPNTPTAMLAGWAVLLLGFASLMLVIHGVTR